MAAPVGSHFDTGTNSVTPTYPGATAKNKLYVFVTGHCTTAFTLSGATTGWSAVYQFSIGGVENIELWTKVAVGSDTMPAWNGASGTQMASTIYEVPGILDIDQAATLSTGTTSPNTVTCPSDDEIANELVLFAGAFRAASAGTTSIGISGNLTGVTVEGDSSGISQASHQLSAYGTGVGISPDSLTLSSSQVTQRTGIIMISLKVMALTANGSVKVSGSAALSGAVGSLAANGHVIVSGGGGFPSPPGPPDVLGQNPFWYTPDQILAQLTAATVTESWRFEWLDATGEVIDDITSFVTDCTVEHDSTRDVMRTCTMSMMGKVPVNFSTDYIKVFYRLKMPAGDWVDLALGVFVFDLPTKTIDPAMNTFAATGNDPTFLLVDDSFTDTYSLLPGAQAIPAVLALLGDIPFDPEIQDSGIVITTTITHVAGDTKLSAVNDILAAAGYENLWCDSNGVPRARPLIDFTLVPPAATFDTTVEANNVVVGDITEAPDRSNAYNQIVVEVSPAGDTAFTVVYINDNPDSPVSTINWHPRTIVVQNSSLADVTAATAFAQSQAQLFARVFVEVTMTTWPWPLSENMDVYGMIWNTEDEGLVTYNYVETGWTHVCGTGQPTTHVLQRIVPV